MAVLILRRRRDTYASKGMHSVIPIRWNDAAGKLTIGRAFGDFAGMAKSADFTCFRDRESRSQAPPSLPQFHQEADYNGEAVSVTTR